MEMEKCKVLIQLLLIFRQFGDVLPFLYARRLRGYTATAGKQYSPKSLHAFCLSHFYNVKLSTNPTPYYDLPVRFP